MINHGSGYFQGIFSALCTGTHGSGVDLPAITETLRAVTVMVLDDRGVPRILLVQPSTIGRRVFVPTTGTASIGPIVPGTSVPAERVCDDEVFDALAMSLGCMGVVLSVTIEVQEDEMWLEERRYLSSWGAVRGLLPAQARSARHVEIQLNPHVPPGSDPADSAKHVAQLVERKPTPSRSREGRRPPGLWFGASSLAPGMVGRNIQTIIKKPELLSARTSSGLGCTAYADPHKVFRRTMSEVLLLNLQYAGIGAEWAVPLDVASAATEKILELSRRIDARLIAAYKDERADYDAELAKGAPLTAVLTLRFVATPARGHRVAMNHRATSGAPTTSWCVFEIGMLGVPAWETWEPVPDATYSAYLKGRVRTLQAIDDLLRPFGARPRWGLYNFIDDARASDLWGQSWESWKRVRKSLDPHRMFRNRFTDRLEL
jgi:hypothetical protein